MKALGMQSGDIPDSAITASSFGGSGLAPYVGRLHFLSSGSGKQGSWAARTSDVNQWFQVNFGKWTKITAVASQGRQDYDEWVGSYTLAYSYEGVFYTPVNREDGLIKVRACEIKTINCKVIITIVTKYPTKVICKKKKKDIMQIKNVPPPA